MSRNMIIELNVRDIVVRDGGDLVYWLWGE